MSAQDTIKTLEQTKAHITQKPQDLVPVATTINNIASALKDLAVQQWCAQFYHDLFSSESMKIPMYLKQQAAKAVFPSMIKLSEVKDVTIYRNIISAFTSVYELIFDLVAKTSDGHLWDQVCGLKDYIIQNWRTAYPLTPKDNDSDKFRSIGSKIASIKFIGKVVVVQSSITPPSSSTDPRARNTPPSFNGNNNNNANNSSEISVNNLPDGHHILSKTKLMAEAEGLMDSLLRFFQEEELLVSQVFITVLNTLIFIMQKRRYLSPKVFQAIADFDYNTKFQATDDDLLTYKLHKRFIARAIKNALNYSIRAGLINSTSPFNSKFSRLVATIDGRMSEQKKRGILNDGPLDKPNKKAKVETPFPNSSTTMDDTEYKSLYQLIGEDNELADIDASQIPHETLVNLANTVLTNVDTTQLITALTMVSQRYTEITFKTSQGLDAGSREVKNDEDQKLQDDEDNAHILNGEDDGTFNDDGLDSSLQTSFVLPPPKKFTIDEKKKHLSFIINNYFEFAKELENEDLVNSFNYNTNSANGTEGDSENNNINVPKIAISEWKKNSWLILLTRLATRGLDNKISELKREGATIKENSEEFSDLIREAIFNYSMENILERIDIVIDWLNEEWYAEFTKNTQNQGNTTIDELSVQTPTYFNWAERLLDSTIPYIEATSTRTFVRLLSDLPTLNQNLIYKLKSLCIDPLRTKLGMHSLMFLMMYRPPVKPYCVGLLKELQQENEELREKAQNILDKYGA